MLLSRLPPVTMIAIHWAVLEVWMKSQRVHHHQAKYNFMSWGKQIIKKPFSRQNVKVLLDLSSPSKVTMIAIHGQLFKSQGSLRQWPEVHHQASYDMSSGQRSQRPFRRQVKCGGSSSFMFFIQIHYDCNSRSSSSSLNEVWDFMFSIQSHYDCNPHSSSSLSEVWTGVHHHQATYNLCHQATDRS